MVSKYLLKSVEQHACNIEWTLMLLCGPCLWDFAGSLQVHPLCNFTALMEAVGDRRGCVLVYVWYLLTSLLFVINPGTAL